MSQFFSVTPRSQAAMANAITNLGSAFSSGPSASQRALTTAKLAQIEREAEKERRTQEARNSIAAIFEATKNADGTRNNLNATGAAAAGVRGGLDPNKVAAYTRFLIFNARNGNQGAYPHDVRLGARGGAGGAIGPNTATDVTSQEAIRGRNAANLANRAAMVANIGQSGADRRGALDREQRRFLALNREAGRDRRFDLTGERTAGAKAADRAADLEAEKEKIRLRAELRAKTPRTDKTALPPPKEVQGYISGATGMDGDDIDAGLQTEIEKRALARARAKGITVPEAIIEISREMKEGGEINVDRSFWGGTNYTYVPKGGKFLKPQPGGPRAAPAKPKAGGIQYRKNPRTGKIEVVR